MTLGSFAVAPDQLDSLYLSVPPYQELVACQALDRPGALPLGAILLAPYEASSQLTLLAMAAPGAMILLRIRAEQGFPFTEIERLREAGVAGIVPVSGHLPLPVLLAAARSAAAGSRGQIGPRLRLMGYVVPARFETWLERLVVGSAATWRTRDWTASAGESIRSLERHCAEVWRIPSPRRWLELMRVIKAVQALQSRPHASVESSLALAGFGDVRRIRESVRRVCGVPPSFARQLIGWQWIIESWGRTFWPLGYSAGGPSIPSESDPPADRSG
jgi:hypothetical protein